MSEPEHGLGGKLGAVAGRSNQGKRIVHTMDPDFFVGIGRISAFGAKKYHMRNFLMAPGMAWGSVFDSLIGHLMAHWGGEDLDEESGEPHILHAAWNMMVLYTYWHNEAYHPGDDRPAKVEYEGKAWKDWKATFDAIRLKEDHRKPWGYAEQAEQVIRLAMETGTPINIVTVGDVHHITVGGKASES